MNISIRPGKPEDAATIAAYNQAMAQETEGKELPASLINPGVATLLNNAEKGRYWVAEADGKIVGQIMVTYEWSDWRNGTMWWIQSVFVHPEHRRQGVYTSLYRHVESLANEDRDCCGIRLYVEKDNRRAMQTYVALGMMKPGYEVMEVDFRKQQAAPGKATYRC